MPGRPAELRVLQSEDAATLADMAALFSAVFGEAGGPVAALPRRTYLERLLARERFIAIAALVGDGVVGGLVAHELPKLMAERSEIYIYDLAVAEPHRRRGIATGLITELTRVARQRGASSIYVQADPDDEAATALYAKLGTRSDVLHFDFGVT